MPPRQAGSGATPDARSCGARGCGTTITSSGRPTRPSWTSSSNRSRGQGGDRRVPNGWGTRISGRRHWKTWVDRRCSARPPLTLAAQTRRSSPLGTPAYGVVRMWNASRSALANAAIGAVLEPASTSSPPSLRCSSPSGDGDQDRRLKRRAAYGRGGHGRPDASPHPTTPRRPRVTAYHCPSGCTRRCRTSTTPPVQRGRAPSPPRCTLGVRGSVAAPLRHSDADRVRTDGMVQTKTSGGGKQYATD
jgi:hypothetical protein